MHRNMPIKKCREYTRVYVITLKCSEWWWFFSPLFSRLIFCFAISFHNRKGNLKHISQTKLRAVSNGKTCFPHFLSPLATPWHPAWGLRCGFPTTPEKQECEERPALPRSSRQHSPQPQLPKRPARPWLCAAPAHQGPLSLWIMKAPWVCLLEHTDQLRPRCWKHNKGFPSLVSMST